MQTYKIVARAEDGKETVLRRGVKGEDALRELQCWMPNGYVNLYDSRGKKCVSVRIEEESSNG